MVNGRMVKGIDPELENNLIGLFGSIAAFIGALGAMLTITASTPLGAAVLITISYYMIAIIAAYFIAKFIVWYWRTYCDPCTLACFLWCPIFS